jgi:hypothetical protein
MKWTTRAEDAQTAHWYGFKASERTTVPCNHACKTFVKNGKKYITHYMPSGTESDEAIEDPTPETRKLPQGERGTWRRGQKKKGGA